MIKYINWLRYLRFCITTFIVVMCSSCGGNSDRLLSGLDEAIENREVYTNEFVNRMDSIKTMYRSAETNSERWKYADAIFKEYVHFSLDSAPTTP